jgi:hypothetical protein
MNTTFIIAIIGAAAWLPQIISWLTNLIVKPKLRFVPEETSEIGYTFFGPIFNQSFAISTSNKDALIERVAIRIVHESGAKHEFWWKFLDERGPEITSLKTGERAEWRKNQPAIALKVSTLGLAEKKIGFQDLSYQGKLIALLQKYQEIESHLEKTKPQTYLEQAVKSKEFLDLTEYIKSGFYWVEGKYDVYLFVYEASLKKAHMEHFKLELSKANIEQLEKNIKITQDHFRDLVLFKGKEKERPIYSWRWVNPVFSRVSKK